MGHTDVDVDVERGRDEHTAGVIARPPVLFLTALLLGLTFDRLVPLPLPTAAGSPLRWLVGAMLIAVGISVFVAGVRDFSRADTPVPTSQPVRALVTSGMHGRSRNPIYLGMFLVYAGIAVAASSPWALLLELPVAIVIRYGVVAREEAYLERLFGDAYREYRTRVRRWL
jgi:protein-S-isoprenylcysteine O-methyltransferase Ste14